jgi:hypothetical protein
MADRSKSADPNVWKRLRENRERNAPFFRAAGARPELADQLDCPSCGAQENAVFWTLRRIDEKRLHLLCPICERGRATYRLSGKRPRRRGMVAAAFGAAALSGVAGMVLLIREAPPREEDRIRARVVALEIYESGASLVGRAVRPVAALLPGLDYDPPPRPRPAPAAERAWSPTVEQAAPAPSRRTRAPAARPATTGERRPPAAAERAPEPLVLVASGDRREELARIREELGGEAGGQLLEVFYDPELDRTRVVVSDTASLWTRRLSWLQGWRAAPE